MILLIDNYDSFTYNLYQYIGEVNEDVKVIRNDAVTVDELKQMELEGIILSPGPGVPENAGICVDVIRTFGGKIPILGICLGHQAIAYAYGGNVIRAETVKHGKTSMIEHQDDKLFEGTDNPLKVMRYHSLVVEEHSLPEVLTVTARSLDDGVIMAMKHKEYAVYGVQFHPESVFTEQGRTIIKNFLIGICNVKANHQ
ncbi:anthranilate synthase component ii signature [Trichococcus palustris]|jgi:anthranilate synthase component II|uniref:Anthranilate synthase component ii signature n=1 Tax=Trichococcus palustris TaxID=140314 RepID=A0A143Z015_9LACT|nr:aminodeoxychorismate/anthranilate synthase component II [Trichococcus palustris]CZR03062.1 anthranilate synthase component ii signature [Trichococcus palustris]SFL22738.1 anthranilate synthase component 2 [Trichococcus palustris]